MESMRKSEIDGIKVITEHVPGMKSVSIGLWVAVGSRYEKKNESGMTHFIEHVVFKGTKKRKTHEIARAIEGRGGVLDAFTSRENTCFYARVLDEDMPVAVDVLTDLVFNPIFPPEEIEKERNVVIEEIKKEEDDPDDLLINLLFESLFSNPSFYHPIVGDEETVKAIKREDIISFWERYYNPAHIIVTAAGNVEHEKFVEELEKRIEVKKKERINPEPAGERERKVVIKEKEGVNQVYIALGRRSYPYSSPYRYHLLFLTSVLGGGMSSRLFQRIREEKGLAYAINTYLDFYLDTGIFGVYLATSPENVASAVGMVREEMEKLRKEGMGKEEWEEVRRQIKGGLILSLESMTNRMLKLAREEMYTQEHSTLEELIEKIEKVKKEEVEELAREMLDPSSYTMVLVGNTKGIKEDVLS
ncbi:insulinase family protein [bacterium]|nr:MAG: insulinase family protein [bacterium]